MSKTAVAVVSKEEDSEISQRAGRAPYFLIFEDKKLVEVWSNPFAVGGGGAGWSVAKTLSDKGVDKVIAGQFGRIWLLPLSSGVLSIKKHQE